MKMALVCGHISISQKNDDGNIEITCFNLIDADHPCVLYSGEILHLLEIQSAYCLYLS